MKRILILLFIFLSALAGWLTILELKIFEIKEVKLKGEYKLIEKDIVEKLYNLKGINIYLIDIKFLKSEILRDVRVESVNIVKKYPSTIEITLVENKEKAMVYINDEYFFINKNLIPFSKYDEINNENLPIITLDTENSEKFKILIENISNTEIYKNISEIYFKDNVFEMIMLDGTKIYTLENVKSKKYDLAYKIYLEEKINNNLEYIDLRFKDIIIK